MANFKQRKIENNLLTQKNTISKDFLSRSILIGSSHTRELEKAVNEPKHMKSILIL